jgi:hypothetical protein
MRTEERSVLIAVLIPLFYGILMLIEYGSIVLPFPLNEVIFASVALYFGLRHHKHFVLQSTFSSAFAVFNLLSSEFFWTTFLDHDQMSSMVTGGTMDLLKLMSSVFMILWGGICLVRGSDKVRSSLFLVFFILYSAAMIYGIYPLLILSALVPFVASFKYKDLYPFHLLWLLFSFLETMKMVMLIYAR